MKEGATLRFKCSSDEGNPPPVIHWTQRNGMSKIISGRFHASVTESTLDITADRIMDKEEFGCYIEEDERKGQKRLEQKVTLTVKCMPLFIFKSLVPLL